MSASSLLRPQEHYRIPASHDIPGLFVRRQPPLEARTVARCPVVYIHGATFPSALSIAHRFDGYSWMDHLATAGFDTWAFDFVGYGESERWPQRGERWRPEGPPGRATIAAKQLLRVVDLVVKEAGCDRVSLIAHSWGTMPACLYATQAPERVHRLVLFAPIVNRCLSPVKRSVLRLCRLAGYMDPKRVAPSLFISLQAQWKRFTEDVPAQHPPVLMQRHFDEWGPAYLATDSRSHERSPRSVEIPGGAQADILAAWSLNQLPYVPARIQAPTLVVRGEWDSVTQDADVRSLMRRLTAAPVRRDAVINSATHLMHLEQSRHQLYRVVNGFLEEDIGRAG